MIIEILDTVICQAEKNQHEIDTVLLGRNLFSIFQKEVGSKNNSKIKHKGIDIEVGINDDLFEILLLNK